MAIILFPRLSPLGVERFLEDVADRPIDPVEVESTPSEYEAFVSFAASGGTRVESAPFAVGRVLRETAEDHGFPGNESQRARADFDSAAAVILHELDALDSPESLRDDIWSFISVVAAPDVVAWRFPDRNPERFKGGVRNAFQRLWVRSRALDRGVDHPDRWALLETITEDGLVQIFERPSLGGNHRLARAIAEGWAHTAASEGRAMMEGVMRRAVKLIRLRNEIQDVAALPSAELKEFIATAFELGVLLEHSGSETGSAPHPYPPTETAGDGAQQSAEPRK